MNTEHSFTWRWRFNFLLSAFIGFAWGILLGWHQVRLNAYLSAWLTLAVTLPLAFWGSMLAGLAFDLMLPMWHKLARWLSAVFIVILGLPWGMLWASLGDGIDFIHLVRATGWTPWQLEWAMVLVGLLGGMFPRWILIWLRPLAKLAYGLVSSPLGIIQGLVNLILSVPRRATQWATRVSLPSPRALVPPSSAEHVPTSRLLRRGGRRSKAKKVIATARNNNHNGARIVAHIEDRCPYCFDIIKPNDPRGVRVCDVCGAPHHADCWAVAGKCQVPHLNV
jgi:hypothetical protein